MEFHIRYILTSFQSKCTILDIQTGSITADNASNNDTLVDSLEILLSDHGFCGHAQRVRCFAHTLNLTAKATLHQFEKRKGNKKKCTDNDNNTSDFEDVPLLEPIGDHDINDDGESDLFDLDELPELVNEEGDEGEKAEKDEEEIVNIFGTLTIEEQECWKEEVKPIRSALYKVSC